MKTISLNEYDVIIHTNASSPFGGDAIKLISKNEKIEEFEKNSKIGAAQHCAFSIFAFEF